MKEKTKTWIQYDKTLPYLEDSDPTKMPSAYLVKDKENSYKIIDKRRPSKLLLIENLRKEVVKWRDSNYFGASKTTKQLLDFWFNADHLVNGMKFEFWYCQREAIETLIYLYEVKKYNDLSNVLQDYGSNSYRPPLTKSFEIAVDVRNNRKLIRFYPELNQIGEQDIPKEGLLRYAFKMATGSGKTFVMALVIIWSYYNKLIEKNNRFTDNFLILSPNVIVYERLIKDFGENKIFFSYPFIPKSLFEYWNLKITSRGDNPQLYAHNNLIIYNIQQLYSSDDWEPNNIIDQIMGKKAQINILIKQERILEKILQLNEILVINDEAHHIHSENLKWHEILTKIHTSIKNGITLWLDFSATPKDQNGKFFSWIIVDYPLAQAIEDRIIKVPLIVHRIEHPEEKEITRDNIAQKYGDWITIALERWKSHYDIYQKIGKKPVLFIMTEKNSYADKIFQLIESQKNLYRLKNNEIVVIHTDKSGEIKDLEIARRLVNDIDSPNNKVKVIISVLMLKEGWDVQNVTVCLGLRPFSSKAQILPEQAIGRGLRRMKGIHSELTQTLEIIGTEKFEELVKSLETEGVGINIVQNPPPLPISIFPDKNKLEYDITIPMTGVQYIRNYKNLSKFDILKLDNLYSSNDLDESKKILLQMEFPITETTVHEEEITPKNLPSGRELIIHITKEIMKRTKLVSFFYKLYPLVEHYIIEKCFKHKIYDIENLKFRNILTDIVIQENIIELLSREIGNLTLETQEIHIVPNSIKLSEQPEFLWRRKYKKLNKCIFNFVPVYNDFELNFAEFLDKIEDISKFSSLASIFKIDYLSEKGYIRFYYPDFIAVQRINNEEIYWIIETKGREYDDVSNKEIAIRRWCQSIFNELKIKWEYLFVTQKLFDSNYQNLKSFEGLVYLIKNN